jgi:hypothetical protein
VVPQNPDPDAERRKWAARAQEHLHAVTAAVDGLRKLFEADLETPVEADEDVAAQVVSACDSLHGWLRSSHAPRGLAKAGGELGAAAGVYRNAAVAFRSLTDVHGRQRQARSAACTRLLEQGGRHVERFAGALAKKLGDTAP